MRKSTVDELTLARVASLIAARFKVQYTVPGVWYLLRCRGWSCQLGARRAVERGDGAIKVRKKEAWSAVKEPRRPSVPGSSSGTRPASR
jgi:transposase